jgi:2,3-bisphosphoglycerate-independent phosphoglycerate mutase
MLAWNRHPRLVAPAGPVVLAILDGVGLGGGGEDDAVARARTPTLDWLTAHASFRALAAHGTAVGLPSDDDMGNSEVGHNAIGAGRVFDQGAKRVEQALASGALWSSDVWRSLCDGQTLHFLGLVSDGNVHSHVDHLTAMIQRAAATGVRRVRVHALTDGRDVGPRTALTWIRPLEALLAALSGPDRDYRIASGGGRMHLTLDRYEADWEMVARGWRCHVRGEGRTFRSASEAIETFYAENPSVDDQWLPAFVVADADGPVGRIHDGDSVLLFHFRGDRAIEISRAFEDTDFTAFDRGHRPEVTFAGMMQYDGDLHLPRRFLVTPPAIDRTVGEHLCAAGVPTLACSETQKFGHVTYFFNGNRSGRIDDRLETWVEVPSDQRPFAERPWMKCAEIADVTVDALARGARGHLRVNFANGDMVGHTGALAPTIQAVEAVDLQLGRLVSAVRQAGGVLLVTADHGNADEMYMRDKKGQIQRDAHGTPAARTSHTLNPVGFWAWSPAGRLPLAELPGAGIASVGTTVLELCGIARPDGYLPGLLAL